MTVDTQSAIDTGEPLDLQMLCEMIPAMVVCTLPDGSVEFANRAWQEYSGDSLQQLRGSGWQTAIHPDDVRGFVGEWNANLPTAKPFATEVRLRRADGQYHWFLIRKALAIPPNRGSNSSLRTLIACENINERKQAEARLHQSETQLQAFLENSPNMVFLKDREGRYLYANREFKRAQRIIEEPINGKTDNELFPAEQASIFQASDRQVLEAGVPIEFYQVTVEKDGQHTGIVQQFPLFNADGEIYAIGGIVRDVTERKREESQRKRAEEEARESERRYREVQTELAHANRVATMGQLSASIAHEINQPIGAAANNAYAALRWLDADPPDLEESRQALGRIVKNVDRAADVIGRIRALVKKTPPRMDGIQVNEAIREVIALTHGEVVKNGVSVQTQLAEALPLVQGDRIQLQQVVLNLTINAVEAISSEREGSRELVISTVKANSDELLIAVRDSGPGLDSASLERVFDAFYTTKPGGLGIGLSICRSIVEAHGGRLWASANLPRGASFQFTLPAHPDGSS
jgi:hypothetical protein